MAFKPVLGWLKGHHLEKIIGDIRQGVCIKPFAIETMFAYSLSQFKSKLLMKHSEIQIGFKPC